MAVFQHIEPPGLIAAHHPHMVRHHVEDMTPVVLEPLKLVHAVDFRIERVVVDIVVTVAAARTRPQLGRGVAVVDGECGEVR